MQIKNRFIKSNIKYTKNISLTKPYKLYIVRHLYVK